MNKEKILESSRRENKNRDLAEMEVTAQAGNIAGRVGAAVCVVLTLIFRIFTKTYFLSPWVVYFSILTTHTLVKYTSVYKGYKRDKIEMRGDRAEMSDFPLYLNTVAGGLDRRDQTIGGFSFVVKIYAVPVVEIIG